MREINKKCVILSLNTGSLKEDLKQIKSLSLPFKCLIGAYKGKLEDSYLIVYNTYQELRKIIILAQANFQESILILREDRTCFLRYFNQTERVELGKLVSVSRDKAHLEDTWTLDLKTNKFYITEGL